MAVLGVALASAALGLSLLRHMGEKDSIQPNPILSPTSASIGMGMTLGGAGGSTRDQIVAALFPGLREAEIHKGFGDFIRSLDAIDDVNTTLDVVNRLFVQRGFNLAPDFIRLCADRYRNPVEVVNYAQAETARSTINDWVASQTNERIQELIPPNTLNALTRLLLVNAVYFKGDWVTPFRREYTFNANFEVARGEFRKVEMMNMERWLPYAEDDSVQVLRLDYKGGDGVAMFVFLPKERFGLDEWLGSVDGGRLSRLMAACRSNGSVDVLLPKWRAEMGLSLAETLKSMGVEEAFDSDADFSRMLGERGQSLRISDVLHKAFVKVDELGSEAAAATAVVMTAKSSRFLPRQFWVDQPFMYAIAKEAGNGAFHILFQGILRRPEEILT